MALPRLDVSGNDFTVTKWNTLISSLESVLTEVVGKGVVSGLDLSIGTGLEVNVSNGVTSVLSYNTLTSLSPVTMPASSTRYIWVSETGTLSLTTTSTDPGGNLVCLGKAISGASTITSVSLDGRMQLCMKLSDTRQVGGYAAVSISTADVTLSLSQFKCRVIVLSGALTGNRNLIVPADAGQEWTILDNTTGAFAVTVKTFGGTGIALAHTKTCKVFCDGTNVLRATADV